MKIYTPQAVKCEADKITNAYVAHKGWQSLEQSRFDLQEIFEAVIYPEYEIRWCGDYDLGEENGQKLLGKAIPDEKLALIDRSIAPPSNDPQFIFTLAHEFGHLILHSENGTAECSSMSVAQKDLREREANLFAEHLLMPDWWVRAQFIRCYQLDALQKLFRYAGKGFYSFSPQGLRHTRYIVSWQEFLVRLGRPLTPYFSDVSKTSMGVKLSRLGLAINITQEKFKDTMPPPGNLMMEVLEVVFRAAAQVA